MLTFIRENYKIFLIGIVGFFLTFLLNAQEGSAGSINIDRLTIENGDLNFWVKAKKNDKLVSSLGNDDFKISETLDGGETNDAVNIYETIDTIIYATKEEQVSEEIISFLLDLSADSMTESDLNNAKKTIKKVLRDRADFSNTKFTLTTFSDKIHQERIPISANNTALLDTLSLRPAYPDFYRILIDELKYLKSRTENKTLFVFSSDANIPEGNIYQKQLAISEEDIQNVVASLSNLNIFIIPLNENHSIEILKNLKGNGSNDLSVFCLDGKLPDDYQDKLGKKRKVLSNYLIRAIPTNSKFKGEKRNYIIEFKKSEAHKEFRLGSVNFPINTQINFGWTNWVILFVSGIIAILVFLGYGSLAKPYFQEKKFFKKYVSKYVTEKDIVRYDILYNEPIMAGEEVVNKCRQITPFETWKENNWECPNYPICLNQNCNGAGVHEPNDFFQMDGIYLKLNWILFGMMGGLLAWMIITLVKMFDFQGFNSIITSIIGSDFLNTISQDHPNLVAQTISNDLLVGIAFGTGLIIMLSWMEERRSSIKTSILNSVGKVSIKTLTGIILSMLVFFGGFYLQYGMGVHSYLSGLISWLLFGVVIGITISVSSSIGRLNGIAGGVLATLFAFNAYWLMTEFLNLGFMESNLISMILLGAIIGSVVVNVVTRLEDYELKLIAPAGYQKTIPISKWIKSNIGVMIGKSPSSYVYIKWDDGEVRPEHAELISQDGAIYLKPIEETLVNRKIVSKPVPLKNGDIIQLGRSSVTQFQFVEK